MTVEPRDVYAMLNKVRYDLTAAQAKLSDVHKLLRELDIPDRPSFRCETCAWTFRRRTELAEHVYHAHDGPLPDHWARSDQLAANSELFEHLSGERS